MTPIHQSRILITQLLNSNTIAILLLLTTHVLADAPTLVINPAYTVIEETTLYVQGGTDAVSGKPLSQFYSLDLTQPNWNVASPPWKALNSLGAPADFSHSISTLKNEGNFIIWGPTTGISTYNGNSWSTVPLPANATEGVYGLDEVYDPGTGLIYVPAGGNMGKNMLQFNPTTLETAFLPIPSTFGGNSVVHYTSAWSTLRNTYKGTKFVLFGGHTPARQPLGSIYVLDLASMTWTKGIDINPSLNRNGMACAVVGDNFIAWGGGQGGTFVAALATPVIYNLKSNLWVNEISTTSDNTPPNPGPTDTGGSKESSSNVGIIVGAVGGAVLLIAIIGIIIFKRRKSSNKPQEKTTTNTIGGLDTHSQLFDTSPINSSIRYEAPSMMGGFSHQPDYQTNRYSNTGEVYGYGYGYNHGQPDRNSDYYNSNQRHSSYDSTPPAINYGYTQPYEYQQPQVQSTEWNPNYSQSINRTSFTTPPPSAGWTQQQQSIPVTPSTSTHIIASFTPPKLPPNNPHCIPITSFDSESNIRNPQEIP
ncbi:hypothetical protein BGZ76_011673 [Entomortierella beljakovae]|nr:hypothetical protein BGZ76_011673 [Entomortierella beljakovae]